MNKKKTDKYSPTPMRIGDAINKSIVIKDFLPPPKDLFLKEKSRKITLNLSEKSLLFFKSSAKKFKVPYQRMIKQVLDKYTELYK